ncbi:MAG: hypothetical protein U0234_21375 [Sandaracinus sp.]
MRRALLALLCVIGVAPLAHAQTAADAELAAIREQVLYASYPEAIEQAQALLARRDLGASERNAGLELLATAQIANQEAEAARETLRLLYSRDPGFRLTDADASPPVISAFARAREAHPEPVRVTIGHSSPGTLAHRESPTIQVDLLDGADAVEEVRLSYRHAGDAGYSRVVLDRRPNGSFVARIPVVGPTDRAIDVAYYLTAVSPSGAELAHLGSDAQPLALRIPAEAADASAGPVAPLEPPPSGGGDVASEPWFWILLGVVVVGAGVGIGFGVDAATRGPEPGTLGVVTLML